MCGRFVFTPKEDFNDRFQVDNQLELPLNETVIVSPGQVFPVIVNLGATLVWSMKWGLIPFWAKERRIGDNMFNARAESIAEKPAFRNAFRNQRCLIPSNGFYEWKTEVNKKTPYFFKLKNHSLFTFAGLYDIWEEPVGGKQIYTFTIITTTPNDVVKPIHDRMPVILEQKHENLWLNQSTPLPTLRQLLQSTKEVLDIVRN